MEASALTEAIEDAHLRNIARFGFRYIFSFLFFLDFFALCLLLHAQCLSYINVNIQREKTTHSFFLHHSLSQLSQRQSFAIDLLFLQAAFLHSSEDLHCHEI